MSEDIPKIFTPQEVADKLGVTKRTVNYHASQRNLKAFKVGNRWRITAPDLNEFLEKRK